MFDLSLPELRAVERHHPDLMVVELHEGQRPFSGLVEQVDWRLCGLISRFAASGRITGELGEKVLVSPGRHLQCQHLLVLGIGRPGECNSLATNRLLDSIILTGEQLLARRLATPLPGRSTGVRAEVAAQFLLGRIMSCPEEMRVIVIEDDLTQAAVAGVLTEDLARA